MMMMTMMMMMMMMMMNYFCGIADRRKNLGLFLAVVIVRDPQRHKYLQEFGSTFKSLNNVNKICSI